MVVKRRRPKPLLIVIVIGILMIIMAFIWIFLSSPVDRSDDTEVKIEIKAGVGTQGIADILKENNLIRSKFVFTAHVKLHNVKSLKAATYIFSPNMNLNEIVKILEEGNIPFYGTSLSNYHSWNIALNSGFRPAWVEIGAEKKK